VIIEVSPTKRDEIRSELDTGYISEKNRKIVEGCMDFAYWLQLTLQESKISIARLKKLFGVKTEKRPPKDETKRDSNRSKDGDDDTDTETKGTESVKPAKDETDNNTDTSQPDPEKDETPKGHGRNPAAVYTGAKEIFVPHKTLRPGDPCPLPCSGTVYPWKNPGIVIRFKGSTIAACEKYILEKLRCGTCNTLFTADLPESAGKDRYDDDLYAILPILKYGTGMPLLRIETIQTWCGVPLSDSTIWDLIEEMATPCYPVYKALIELAACGRLVHHDDTLMRILSLIQENKENPDIARKAIYTSGFVVYVEELKIYLFFTGRKNAGENLDMLLSHRPPILPEIMQMADALAANRTKEVMTILCNCLAHGRRKFHEILDFFPRDCHYVLDVLAQVYKNDSDAKKLGLSPQERLEHHKKHSAQVMEMLHEWLQKQIAEDLVESHSSMGKAIKYMINHWPELTKFLSVAGAPLDNNIVERALKFAIRNRKASMFYKTKHGALIGDIFMSLILTCTEANENPLEYLKALRRNQKHVFAEPKQWFPWNYKENLQEDGEVAAQTGPPPELGDFSPVSWDSGAQGVAIP